MEVDAEAMKVREHQQVQVQVQRSLQEAESQSFPLYHPQVEQAIRKTEELHRVLPQKRGLSRGGLGLPGREVEGAVLRGHKCGGWPGPDGSAGHHPGGAGTSARRRPTRSGFSSGGFFWVGDIKEKYIP